jgi:hypothetical protein
MFKEYAIANMFGIFNTGLYDAIKEVGQTGEKREIEYFLPKQAWLPNMQQSNFFPMPIRTGTLEFGRW